MSAWNIKKPTKEDGWILAVVQAVNNDQVVVHIEHIVCRVGNEGLLYLEDGDQMGWNHHVDYVLMWVGFDVVERLIEGCI